MVHKKSTLEFWLGHIYGWLRQAFRLLLDVDILYVGEELLERAEDKTSVVYDGSVILLA